MMPPLFIYVRIGRVPLPLPALLLWPLLLALLVLSTLVLPFVPLRGTTAEARARLPLALWRTLAALRGLQVDVRPAHRDRVKIVFW
jgi:hypothetical protein